MGDLAYNEMKHGTITLQPCAPGAGRPGPFHKTTLHLRPKCKWFVTKDRKLQFHSGPHIQRDFALIFMKLVEATHDGMIYLETEIEKFH